MSRVFREDLSHYYCTPLSQNWKLRLSPHYSNPFQCILPSLKIKSQFYNIKSTSGSTLHITLSKSSMKYTFQVPLPQEILGSLRTPRFEIRFWVKGRFFLCEPSHYSNYNITCTNMVVDVIWTFFLHLSSWHTHTNHRSEECEVSMINEITIKFQPYLLHTNLNVSSSVLACFTSLYRKVL